jgi:hypothetical protein
VELLELERRAKAVPVDLAAVIEPQPGPEAVPVDSAQDLRRDRPDLLADNIAENDESVPQDNSGHIFGMPNS